MPDNTEKSITGTENSTYLPDFCDGDVFLRLLLVVELIAIVFALVSFGGGSLFVHIALISVTMLWVGLTTAALLCLIKRQDWLGNDIRTTVIAIMVVLAMTLLVSFMSLGLGSMMRFGPTAQDMGFTLMRNLAIAVILIGLALRYFYLHHESEVHLQVQAQARLQALQARIRPHFLFNSMNTIASLTHDQPALAEQAIENLSDLFRASLAAESSISLQQELELTHSYIDLEALRLGERLEVDWEMPEQEPSLFLPALTLQPLVENAIYHGIEPLPAGGKIEIAVEQTGANIVISISNPLIQEQPDKQRKGNRMAIENIHERLALAFGGAASMELLESETRYTVKLTIPTTEAV
ncbi:MAG: sensor histidine kinase [Gammaproteobacteria bacterium]|nr:sensor histidine kinase [Gammaproteobacteria bacterium]MCP4388454.1 sensor histidine kinase [Gammaproteobacteria bacterium]MCP4980680.1 sensor histidine kinase [Gammaproteobacteria bacterium]